MEEASYMEPPACVTVEDSSMEGVPNTLVGVASLQLEVALLVWHEVVEVAFSQA